MSFIQYITASDLFFGGFCLRHTENVLKVHVSSLMLPASLTQI